MIGNLFQVATEFRFDVGHAVLSSETLQSKVQGISDAADNALLSFQNLSAGVVADFGLGGGGVIGSLLKAIQVSDKFNQSALGFSNVISANMQFLQGDIGTFNDRLNVSKKILGDIATQANKFSLDEGALLNMTKMLAPVLIPHGAAGKNMSNAVDLGRNVLKASPTLGLDPNEIQGQLVRTIMGQASMGDTLFRRLVSETSAFSSIGKNKNASGSFNSMSFEKRFEMLHSGLNQFASDLDVINGNAGTLAGNTQRMKNLFGGLNSILKPLGDVILPPILTAFREFNDMLDTKLRPVIVHLSDAFKGLLENPRDLIVNLLQLKQAGKDVKSGASLFGLISLVQLVKHVAGFMGIQMAGGLGKVASMAGSAVASFVAFVPWLKVFGIVAQTAWFALSRMLVPLAAAVGFFQLLSRAQSIAQVNDVKNMITLGPKYAELLARLGKAFSNMMAPFAVVFDTLAEFISPLFQVSTYLNFFLPAFETFVGFMEKLGLVSILAMAGLEGIFFALYKFVENIASGKIRGAFAGVGEAFDAGVTGVLERNAARLAAPGGGVSNQVTNIGKVEIRNEFKENQEPDRIAFTVKEQLLKAGKNPTQGRGTGFQSAFAR